VSARPNHVPYHARKGTTTKSTATTTSGQGVRLRAAPGPPRASAAAYPFELLAGMGA
jgi:hypothetical protein